MPNDTQAQPTTSEADEADQHLLSFLDNMRHNGLLNNGMHAVLSSEVRQAVAVAWDQGYMARSGDSYEQPRTPNPYRPA